KIERITFNLLSNALKFTDKNGKVEVILTVKDAANSHYLEIKVKDTGIGIPADQQEKIFERYFQHDTKNLYNQGNGIGLSITHDYVQLLGGTITLNSQENVGSTFTIDLPLPVNVEKNSDALSALAEVRPDLHPQKHKREQGKKISSILLVDNDEDLIFY